MSDKPTKDPQGGRKVIEYRGAHEKPNYGGSIKETSPGVLKKQIPAKGKECALEKSFNKRESKFTHRTATTVWNRERPHIPADVSSHSERDPGEYQYPKSKKPPECASSYDGHKVAGR